VKISGQFGLTRVMQEGLALVKVFKYKVVSTNFNNDIYGIEIIHLKERLHVLVDILKPMAGLV
jgi:hypothetical protein